MYVCTSYIHVCVYACMCVRATYMYVCTSYIHVGVYELYIHVYVHELHTCMCVYMYVCTSYIHMYVCIHVCVYELHTCNVHVLCDTHINAACAVFISLVPPSSSPSISSFPPTHLPHPYLSPSFLALPFTLQTLDYLPKLSLMVGMLLWSSPNHSPSPPSRAPNGYHVASMGC